MGLPTEKPSCLVWSKGFQTRLRLFCFPHAGAGAVVYKGWAERLPAGVEVCGVSLPGREYRMRERLLVRISHIVASLAAELDPLFDRPIAFFGHSMGALVAFELARLLWNERRLAPVLLIVSGRASPLVPTAFSERIAHLSDAQFLDAVSRIGGTPPEVLSNPDLIEVLLPILRADLTACESYVYSAGEPLRCRIVALGGATDPRVQEREVEAWRSLTSGGFKWRMFPGGHFFVQTCSPSVLEMISAELAAFLTGTESSMVLP